MTLTDSIGEVVKLMRPITVANCYPIEAVNYMAREYANVNSADAPFYLFGHRREINARLLEKQKDKVYKYQRYPLVALRLDAEETIDGGIVQFNLNIALLTFTKTTLDAEQRMEQVFKPLLYPLYEKFLQSLSNSGLFFWDGEYPRHTKIDRPYWGVQDGLGTRDTQHIFSDPIDAIELLDLKISQLKNKC